MAASGASFVHAGGEWRSPTLCTVRRRALCYPEMPRHNIDAVMAAARLNRATPSRMPDCPGAVAAVAEAARRLARGNIAARARGGRSACPPTHGVSPTCRMNCPRTPGVYRFFGEGVHNTHDAAETLCTSARPNNLRERVLGHFHAGGGDAKALRMAAQVRRVEWTRPRASSAHCCSRARGSARRSHLQPAVRDGGERLTWLLASGAATQIVPLDAQVLGTATRSALTAPGAMRARLGIAAREHQWCLKLLGLERRRGGLGSCVGFQMGRCRGGVSRRRRAQKTSPPRRAPKDRPRETPAVH